MSEPVFIRVREVVGGALCVATQDGDLVRKKIVPALRERRHAILSFAGVEMVIPAFLSSAIGPLYGEFPETQVDSLVAFQDFPKNDEAMSESSRRWAKAYYRDPVAFRRANGRFWRNEHGRHAEKK